MLAILIIVAGCGRLEPKSGNWEQVYERGQTAPPLPKQRPNLPIPLLDSQGNRLLSPSIITVKGPSAAVSSSPQLSPLVVPPSAQQLATAAISNKEVITVGQLAVAESLANPSDGSNLEDNKVLFPYLPGIGKPQASARVVSDTLTAETSFPKEQLADLLAQPITGTIDFAVSSDVSGSTLLTEDEIRVQRTVQVPILMYHYLSVPPSDADIYRLDLSVTPDMFSQHLDAMLEAGYTTINLYDLWNHLEKGAVLPPNPVILTFDDGYEDNYENAFPRLLQRGMTATFFIVTDFLEVERPGYMSWSMVQELYDAGMAIESHGINHYSLKNRDSDFLIFQALRSKELIEAKIGYAPRFISYPAGEYDQNTIDIFHSADYLMGVTTIQGSTHTNENLFELRRVRVRGTTDAAQLLEFLTIEW